MNDADPVYRDLARYLDRLPAGFPGTSTGVEMRILRRLFTPEEAALAVHLNMKPESPEDIASRIGRDPLETAQHLETLSRKGLIFRIRKGNQARYMAAQFVVGIWEYHVNDLDPELIRDTNEYLPYFFKKNYLSGTPQLRTIPISRALPAEEAVMPYEQAMQIVMEQDKIVVAPCICRKEQLITGRGCGRPLETCLVFGIGAQYYEENGLGRAISREDAVAILDEAEKTGLVLQPSNSQKVVNICVCCGCCCQILKNLKSLPHPSRYVASGYFAMVDAELCSGCGVCSERCQMDAVEMSGESARILRDRCIGCGLCVPTCPAKAVRLQLKPDDERSAPPSHMMETYRKIAMERIERLRAGGGRT
jgi:ferredoxin